MKYLFTKWISILVFCAIPVWLASAATQPPPVGGVLPEIVLKAPDRPEHQAYLGVQEKQTFTIPEIDARIVIIEIFSMY